MKKYLLLTEIFGIVALITQLLFAAALIVYAPFCFVSAAKTRDKLKKGLNIVLGTGALCLGALLILLMVNSWVSQYGMEQAFVFKNMAENGVTDSEYNALALTVLLFLLFILAIIMFVAGVRALSGEKSDDRPARAQLVAGNAVSFSLALMALFSALLFCFLFAAGHYTFVRVQIGKPVIYFYPETETDVNAELGHPDALTVSYPAYSADTGWQFTAFPDGTLVSGGREYPYMYYEFDADVKFGDNGFVVAGKDSAAFLEDKLGSMGLSYKEQTDFITYWLPQLAANDYNRIEFLTGAEVDALMPLAITPAPDNILRVYMLFAPCDASLASELPEQELPELTRTGFVVVEWGGTKLAG